MFVCLFYAVNPLLFIYMTVGVVMTKNSCQKISKSIRKDLVSAGFIVNDEKSVWDPIQRLEWLGFIWDL